MNSTVETFFLVGGVLILIGGAQQSCMAWFKSDYFQTTYLRFWPKPRLHLWFIRILAPLFFFVGLFVTILMSLVVFQ